MTGGSQARGMMHCMMTQQLHVSVLAAPLAAIDRRALSEAWYSALHLAHERRSTATPLHTAQRASILRSPRDRNEPNVTAPSAPDIRQQRLTRDLRAASNGGGETLDLQVRRSKLGRRIARVFSKPHAVPKRVTLSLGRGSARVHVILQTKGNRVMLVAICRPELRPCVARALEHARVALRSGGVGVEQAAKGAAACS
jgi:hypothetical protein